MTTRQPTTDEAHSIRTLFLNDRLKPHEYAQSMPPQSAAEFRELRSSIASKGYDRDQPIVVWRPESDGPRTWLILDGIHRGRAARQVVGAIKMGDLGHARSAAQAQDERELEEDLAHADEELEVEHWEPTWMVFDGSADEALDLVELRNLKGRRNFASPDAKALAAMNLYELRLRDGRARGKASDAPETPAGEQEPFALTVQETEDKGAKPRRIRDEIAEQIGVPPTTVGRARSFTEHAERELGAERAAEIKDKIMSGDMRLSQGQKEVNRAKTKREREEARQEALADPQTSMVDRLTVVTLDALEALRAMGDDSVDIVLMDGPYNLSHGGITVDAGEVARLDKGDWDTFASVKELAMFYKNILSECERVLKPGGQLFAFGTRHVHPTIGALLQGSAVLKIEADIVWVKTNAKPRSTPGLQDDHEVIWWAYKGRRRFVECNAKTTWTGATVGATERKYGAHNCQKPEWLVGRLLELVGATFGDTVVDLFAGSGTGSVRAYAAGATVVAVEKDPQWEPIIRARCSDAVAVGLTAGAAVPDEAEVEEVEPSSSDAVDVGPPYELEGAAASLLTCADWELIEEGTMDFVLGQLNPGVSRFEVVRLALLQRPTVRPASPELDPILEEQLRKEQAAEEAQGKPSLEAQTDAPKVSAKKPKGKKPTAAKPQAKKGTAKPKGKKPTPKAATVAAKPKEAAPRKKGRQAAAEARAS